MTTRHPPPALVLPIKITDVVTGSHSFVYTTGSPTLDSVDADLSFFDVRLILPDVSAMIRRLLADPCPKCGATTKEHHAPGRDLDIVCSAACGWRLPIDTGPCSFGRRVD